MNVYKVVKKLIGNIDPVGETKEDDERYENLKQQIHLIDLLLGDIENVVCNKNRQEFSMKRSGQLADEFLNELGVEH